MKYDILNNIEIPPCLNYLAYLPGLEDRLSVYTKILKKHGWEKDSISRCIEQWKIAELFDEKATPESIKRYFSGSKCSCTNKSGDYFESYGFTISLCEGCPYSPKYKNFKLRQEGEVLAYILDNASEEGIFDKLENDIFEGVAIYYKNTGERLSFRNIPFTKYFFFSLKRMIEEKAYKLFSTRKECFDEVLENMVNTEAIGIEADVLIGIKDDFVKYIMLADKIDSKKYTENISFLNTMINTAEYAKKNEEKTKLNIMDRQNEEDLFNIKLEIATSANKSPINDKVQENLNIAYSNGNEKSKKAMSLEELKQLTKKDIPDFIGQKVSEIKPLPDVIEAEIDKESHSDNEPEKKGIREIEQLKEQASTEQAEQKLPADNGKKPGNENTLFNDNGILILDPDHAYESYTKVFNEDVLDLLEAFDKNKNLSVEVARAGSDYGILVYSPALAKPHFLFGKCISEYVIEELFSKGRYTIYSTSAAMIAGYLFMNDKQNGVDIRSLTAAYVALSQAENYNITEEIFAFCNEDYSDTIDDYLKICMPKYMAVFNCLYEKIEGKHKQGVYRVRRNYEFMLGSSLTLSRYFECNLINLHRKSYHNSLFSYSPLLKKSGRGTVIKYTFWEATKKKNVDMVLTEAILSHAMDDSFLQKYRLVLLSIKAGEIIYFCPYGRPESISLMHQEIVSIIERWFKKMYFSTPIIQINDDLVSGDLAK